MRVVQAAAIAAATVFLTAGAAQAAGEGLSGFKAVEVRVTVPTSPPPYCRLDESILRTRIAERLGAANIPMGTSALTLRARVSTLSNPITKRCVSAIELDAYTSQNTLIQATRNAIIANIPLWSSTGIADSGALGHQSRANASVIALTDKFAAAWRANN